MIRILDVDAWAREIARQEAERVLQIARRGVEGELGLAGALREIRARMRRLTPEQREHLVEALTVDGVGAR